MHSVKMIRLSSLGLKVLATYVVGALLSIALVVAIAVWAVEADVLANLELKERVGILEKKIRFDAHGQPIGFDISTEEQDWLYDSLPQEAAYRVLDAAGNAILVSRSGKVFWPPESSGFQRGMSSFVFQREGMLFYGVSKPVEHKGRYWSLQFATSERLMKLLQRKFALPYMGTGIGIFSAILIVSFGLCAYITLRYALKPLRDISKAAAAISPHSLHERLQTNAIPAEISPLVESFNLTLERLEHGYRVQQEFLANAAHELKTPLALIRAQIELPVDDTSARDALLGDVDYMTRQVQQLLLLAEASEVNNYSFALVPVQEVIKDTIAYLQRVADTAEVSFSVTYSSTEIRWQADRGALFTLLKNLLENAIQHAPRGSTVSIEIYEDEMNVRDFGPGVSANQLPLIFGRFWRGPHRRDHGAGLGLAICQEIAQAHGWGLMAENADPGLQFRLSKEAQD